MSLERLRVQADAGVRSGAAESRLKDARDRYARRALGEEFRPAGRRFEDARQEVSSATGFSLALLAAVCGSYLLGRTTRPGTDWELVNGSLFHAGVGDFYGAPGLAEPSYHRGAWMVDSAEPVFLAPAVVTGAGAVGALGMSVLVPYRTLNEKGEG